MPTRQASLMEHMAADLASVPKRLCGVGRRGGSRRNTRTGSELYYSRVAFNPGGCWEWTGPTSGDYGKFAVNYRAYPAHWITYVGAYGPIPNGMQVDHLCRTTVCVNPLHLEAVTARENIRRGVSCVASQMKELCRRGHEYSPQFVKGQYLQRICTTCRSERLRRYRREKKRDQAASART